MVWVPMIDETMGRFIERGDPDSGSSEDVVVRESGALETGPEGEATDAIGELTEASLEALLFVAERPLTRREIASMAGVDRDTVDARLGDLEVALRARGIRLILRRRSGRAGHGARGRRPHRSFRGHGCRPADTRRARDARDRRVPPASHESGRRADPRGRLGLHHARPAPSSPRHRARALRGPGPADPVRNRLRLPGALRDDLARRPAAARRRRRRPARGSGTRRHGGRSRVDAEPGR